MVKHFINLFDTTEQFELIHMFQCFSFPFDLRSANKHAVNIQVY